MAYTGRATDNNQIKAPDSPDDTVGPSAAAGDHEARLSMDGTAIVCHGAVTGHCNPGLLAKCSGCQVALPCHFGTVDATQGLAIVGQPRG